MPNHSLQSPERQVDLKVVDQDLVGMPNRRFFILLGSIMSKKQGRLRSELLSEDKITNLCFLTYIIKPRRIENLQSQ
jgi:hypothetical protein